MGPRCFSDEQIQKLVSIADEEAQPLWVEHEGKAFKNSEVRSTRGLSLSQDDAHRWVYEIVTGVFLSANETMRYDILPDVSEPIQLLRYDAAEKDFFVWHTDTLPEDMTRKMSVVVPLNDPAEYSGGELEFLQGGAVHRLVQEPGRPVIFPSWLTHQVTPVEAGRRYSLVAWIRGPNWR